MKYDLIGIYTRVGQSKQSCSSTLGLVKTFQVCISFCNLPGKGYIYSLTTARYLEDRAIQLYYHVYVQKEDTDLGDPKAIIRALLSFQGTQAEMIQQSTWMEMIIGSFELWERVVIYGQFLSLIHI